MFTEMVIVNLTNIGLQVAAHLDLTFIKCVQIVYLICLIPIYQQ